MFLIGAVESKDDHAFNTTHSPQIRKRRLQPVAASNRRTFVPVTFQLHVERERVLPIHVRFARPLCRHRQVVANSLLCGIPCFQGRREKVSKRGDCLN